VFIQFSFKIYQLRDNNCLSNLVNFSLKELIYHKVDKSEDNCIYRQIYKRKKNKSKLLLLIKLYYLVICSVIKEIYMHVIYPSVRKGIMEEKGNEKEDEPTCKPELVSH